MFRNVACSGFYERPNVSPSPDFSRNNYSFDGRSSFSIDKLEAIWIISFKVQVKMEVSSQSNGMYVSFIYFFFFLLFFFTREILLNQSLFATIPTIMNAHFLSYMRLP